jgi:hypothetical protein
MAHTHAKNLNILKPANSVKEREDVEHEPGDCRQEYGRLLDAQSFFSA